jgi:hypothetical protein
MTGICVVDGCEHASVAKQMCQRHYVNERRYSGAVPTRERDYAERFRTMYVETPSGCWEWTGAINDSGYGRFRVRLSPDPRAHRVAWIIDNGDIPDGMQVLHRCDNRRCVRVSHLFLGTHDDNMRDMAEKGRAGMRRDDTCRAGHVRDGNTRIVIRANGTRERVCVLCNQERQARYYLRRKSLT